MYSPYAKVDLLDEIYSSAPFTVKGKHNTTHKKLGYRQSPHLSETVTESIARASKNMLSVCACIITFSALSGAICSALYLSDTAQAILSGFFEVSSGATQAAYLSNAAHAPLLCASICAFSGLSVHFQIMSACRGKGISFVPFFIYLDLKTCEACRKMHGKIYATDEKVRTMPPGKWYAVVLSKTRKVVCRIRMVEYGLRQI